MKTIIAGSRTITEYQLVADAARRCGWAITSVVSGCAHGVDELGELYAQNKGLAIHWIPANWDKHGKAAGPIRNRKMAENAEALLAIWDGESRGTASMIKIAKEKGLKIYVHRI